MTQLSLAGVLIAVTRTRRRIRRSGIFIPREM